MLPPLFYEIAGFVGVAFYLGSYAALQAGFVKGNGYVYATLNLLAASFVLMSLFATWNLWSAIIQISWIVLSVVGMTRVWLIKRSLRFTEEEEQLILSKLPTLDRIGARRFLNIGTWRDGHVGEEMTQEGAPVTRVYYLQDGEVDVDVGGQHIAKVGPDHFIGEMACLEQGPASATVRIAQPTRYFTIASDDLSQLIAKYPDIAPHIHFAFSGNTQAKLIGTNLAYSQALRAQQA